MAVMSNPRLAALFSGSPDDAKFEPLIFDAAALERCGRR
jgi:hypothetical protein